MSYISRIDLYRVKVSSNNLKEVASAIEANRRNRTLNFHWMVRSLKLNARGDLHWNEDSRGSWKTHEDFIRNLASWNVTGHVSFWSLEGDGAAWAYEFDGTGGYKLCSAHRISGLKAAESAKVGRTRNETRK